MKPTDAPAFIERLISVAELFNAKLSEGSQALYFDALKDLDLEDVILGLGLSIQQCKFMPKPVEIRELAVGSLDDDADAAWASLKGEMRRVGGANGLIIDGPAAHAVIDTFGTWATACAIELSPEMWASKRKEFMSSFKRHTRDGIDGLWTLNGWLALERRAPVLLPYAPEPKTITS